MLVEACEGRWKPAVQALAARPNDVPSVSEPVAAFNALIRPMERAAHTRGKYKTHLLSVLIWAVRKGILSQSLPISDDLVRAFVWDAAESDALAFETTLLAHCQCLSTA